MHCAPPTASPTWQVWYQGYWVAVNCYGSILRDDHIILSRWQLAILGAALCLAAVANQCAHAMHRRFLFAPAVITPPSSCESSMEADTCSDGRSDSSSRSSSDEQPEDQQTPIARLPPARPRPPAPAPPAPLPPLPAAWRVLVADSNVITRTVLVRVLRRISHRASASAGWLVEETETAQQALAMATVALTNATPSHLGAGVGHRAYDLIVLEWHSVYPYPSHLHGGGMQAATATAAMRAFGITAIILGQTSDDRASHAARGREAGMDEILHIPVTDFVEVGRLLQRLLRDRQLRDAWPSAQCGVLLKHVT